MAVQVEILHEFKPFLEQDAAFSKDHVSLHVCHAQILDKISYKCLKSDLIWIYAAQTSWSVTTDPLTGAAHELCVQGNRVVWLEGLNPAVQTVKKVYSVETDIIQAFWCRFRVRKPRSDGKDYEGDREGRKERESDKRSGDGLLCICVREQNCLTLFLQTGAVHYVPLPFLVSNIHK